MAKKVILGTDIARDAFKVKVNDNFTELYNKDATLEGQINSLVSQRIYKTRDMSLAGVEIVTGLLKKPKRITVFAAVNGTKKWCIGTYSVIDNLNTVIVMNTSGNYYSQNTSIVRVYDTDADFTSGVVQNVTDSQFEIAWTKTGTGATGTLTYQIVVDY